MSIFEDYNHKGQIVAIDKDTNKPEVLSSLKDVTGKSKLRIINETLEEKIDNIINGASPANTKLIGNNIILYDGSVSWLNSVAVGTENNIDISLPSTLQGDAFYEIVVTNPSTESALTVVVKNKETFGGTARYPELTRFNVPVNTPDGKAFIIQGFMLGEAGRLTLSNDTGLGLSGGFTAYVRVRKV